MSSDSGVEMTKEEKSLLKTRDEKLSEQNEKIEKLEDEKIALQQQLLVSFFVITNYNEHLSVQLIYC